MNEELLTSLGLSSKEVAVYKAILAAGKAAPAALAKLSSIKRTTAYSIARGLVEKGLLNEDTTRRPRVFRAATPDEVLGVIEREKRRVDERESSLKTFANELMKVTSQKSYPVPTVRFIEEDKLESFMRAQTRIWDASLLATEPTWWGVQDHTFVEHFSNWIAWYWKQSDERIDLKLLSNRAPVEVQFAKDYKEFERRQIKFWGEADNFRSTTWAVGDYLVMINTRTRPFYLVEIHDKLMAHNQREVFKNLWPLVS